MSLAITGRKRLLALPAFGVTAAILLGACSTEPTADPTPTAVAPELSTVAPAGAVESQLLPVTVTDYAFGVSEGFTERLWVAAIVDNPNPNVLHSWQMNFDLFDADGILVDTLMENETLLPGKNVIVPFAFSEGDEAHSIERIEFRFTQPEDAWEWNIGDIYAAPGSVEFSELELSGGRNYVRLDGLATSSIDEDKAVSIHALVRDPAGNIIGTGWDWLSHLPGNGRARFDMRWWDADFAPGSTIEVFATTRVDSFAGTPQPAGDNTIAVPADLAAALAPAPEVTQPDLELPELTYPEDIDEALALLAELVNSMPAADGLSIAAIIDGRVLTITYTLEMEIPTDAISVFSDLMDDLTADLLQDMLADIGPVGNEFEMVFYAYDATGARIWTWTP